MFNLKIMYKDTSQEVVITEFVRIILDEVVNEKKEKLFLEVKDEITGKDIPISIDKIGYICINHYSYFSIDDFKDAYDTLATSRRSYGSIVSISDILNRLLSMKEEKIYNELIKDFNGKEKNKDSLQNAENDKKVETSSSSEEAYKIIKNNIEKPDAAKINTTKDNKNEK